MGSNMNRLFVIPAIAVMLLAGIFQQNQAFADTKDRVVITDMAGRKVSIPKRIERVVPLGGALRFIVYMQAFDKVVGIEAFEKKNKDNPARPYSLAIADKVDQIPAIGEGGPGDKLPDFEKVMAVRPDVIIAMGLDMSVVETIAQKTGIPVIVLSYGGTGVLDFGLAVDSLRMLGRLLGKEKRAEELASFVNGIRDDLHKRTFRVTQKPSVYVGAVSYRGSHGITSTQGDYMPLKWINGNNIADEIKKTGHLFLDKEKILDWNPDIIFIDMGGVNMVRDDYQKNPDFYRKLKAVNKKTVFSILPFNYYHTNIEIALANAYYMGKVIYPSRFKDIDPAKKADEIFKVFVGVEAYNRLKKDYHGFGRVSFNTDGIAIN